MDKMTGFSSFVFPFPVFHSDPAMFAFFKKVFLYLFHSSGSSLKIQITIMKIYQLLILMLVTLLSCRSGDNSQARKDELKSVLSDYYNALAKKDIQKANALTTSNFVLFDDGAIYSNERALRDIERMKPFTVTFTFDSLNIHMEKRDASAYYFRKAYFTFEDSAYAPVRFLESATFNKEGDKWKIRFLHSTIRK
jgi:ketosteroid isomerase-like protein